VHYFVALLGVATTIALPSAAIITPAQLEDMKECTARGFLSLDSFRGVVPLHSPYGAEPTESVFLPVFASTPLNAVNTSVVRVVVALHGLLSDAQTYFCMAMQAVRAQPGSESTMVIAPWFGNESVSGTDWVGAPAGHSLWFKPATWVWGGNGPPTGLHPPQDYSTAFDALDALVALLNSSGSRQQLPSLQRTTLVGFSAGAQLALRYSIVRHGAASIGGPTLRVIVSDPGSFTYLHSKRPSSVCRPLRNTGVAHTCTTFDETPPEAVTCPNYDTYKYGLSGGFNISLYTAPLDEDKAAVAALIDKFSKRDVRYIFGSADVCNCNTNGFANEALCSHADLTCTPDVSGVVGCCDTFPDDLVSNKVEVGCEAMLTGSNRLQRGLNFVAYLTATYPGFAPHVGAFVGGHDASAMYASQSFVEWALT
jgi:hypothetical protein